MYRGQDIGSKDELIQKCIEILESGQIKRLYSILPHIGLVRSDAFVQPLIHLLQNGIRSQKLFAAMALGSIRDTRGIGPLRKVFDEPRSFYGGGTRSLQKASILALGEIGQDSCLRPLLEIYHLEQPRDTFRFTRKRLVITALGSLAQQGVAGATEALMDVLSESRPRLRAQAVTELGVAFWHSPQDAPVSLLEEFCRLGRDRSTEVRNSVEGALLNLAQLGNGRAERCLDDLFSNGR